MAEFRVAVPTACLSLQTLAHRHDRSAADEGVLTGSRQLGEFGDDARTELDMAVP